MGGAQVMAALRPPELVADLVRQTSKTTTAAAGGVMHRLDGPDSPETLSEVYVKLALRMLGVPKAVGVGKTRVLR